MTNGRRVFVIALGIVVLFALRQSVAEPRIVVQIVPTPQEEPEHGLSIAEASSCDLKDKISEALTMLSSVEPKVGRKTFRWTEQRAGGIRSRKLVERELALVLLRTDTCESKQVTVSVQGDNIVAPDGYEITPVERNNGILMNRWNTQFRATCPGTDGEQVDCVVLANVEPDKKRRVKEREIFTAEGYSKIVPTDTRGVLYRLYVPYSSDLHSFELVREGLWYQRTLSDFAFQELRRKGVYSGAFKDTLVADVELFKPQILEWLMLAEQMDMGEFILEPERTAERVYVIYGTNEARAFKYTCSSKGACGALQFTNRRTRRSRGTYTNIRLGYPAAKLIQDFVTGAQDHRNIVQAALLHLDDTAAFLIRKLGPEIVKDPELFTELNFASYNTSVSAVAAAYKESLKHPGRDWPEFLKNKYPNETRGYVAKLRFLREWDGPTRQFEDI